MRHLIDRFKGKSAEDWGLVLQAVPLVIGARLRLSLAPWRMVRAALESCGSAHDRAFDEAKAGRILWAVGVVSRRVPQASCLTQAMAAHALLHRHGIGSTLHIGVAREATGAFAAHAWLENRERVILGGQVEGYERVLAVQPLPSLNPAESEQK